MKIRSFAATNSIRDLCRPVSAQEVSAEYVKRSSLFAGNEQTENEKIGRLSQASTMRGQGKKTK